MSGRNQRGKVNQRPGLNCNSCEKYVLEPIWGHTLCSYHRKCSGKDFWEPCGDCRKQKGNLKKMSEEDRNKSFHDMYIMLEQTKKNVLELAKVKTMKEFLKIS